MAYEFRPAIRDKTSVLIALAGASGSGKTYTAILMAFGLAYPGMTPDEIMATIAKEGKSRVAFIDTEGGRGKHYAAGPGQRPDFRDTFPYDYTEIIAPYTPENYQSAAEAANDAGYWVIIIDSMSHEYESEGGIQEIADEQEAGRLKPGKTLADTEDRQNGWKAWAIKPVKSPGNWKEPKTRHKKMVNRMIQLRAHVIFCLRAEEKMLMKREPKLDDQGRQKEWNGVPQFETKVVPAEDRPLLERWAPICEKRFMYEMTVSFLLLPSAPGIGHPIKNLQAKFVPMFPEGQHLGVANGRSLAEWATGGVRPEARPDEPNLSDPPTLDIGQGNGGGDPPRQRRSPRQMVDAYKTRLDTLREGAELDAIQNEPATQRWLAGLDDELAAEVEWANRAARDRLDLLADSRRSGPDDDVLFPQEEARDD